MITASLRKQTFIFSILSLWSIFFFNHEIGDIQGAGFTISLLQSSSKNKELQFFTSDPCSILKQRSFNTRKYLTPSFQVKFQHPCLETCALQIQIAPLIQPNLRHCPHLTFQKLSIRASWLSQKWPTAAQIVKGDETKRNPQMRRFEVVAHQPYPEVVWGERTKGICEKEQACCAGESFRCDLKEPPQS